MTTTSTPQYLTNLSKTVLTLRNGSLEIGPGNFAIIYPDDMSQASLQYLIDYDLASVSDTKPVKNKNSPAVEISIDVPYRGMTIEELRASEAETPIPAPATSSALGTTTEAKTPKPKKTVSEVTTETAA